MRYFSFSKTVILLYCHACNAKIVYGNCYLLFVTLRNDVIVPVFLLDADARPEFLCHKGTIKPGVLVAYAIMFLRFNSIKVRLNHFDDLLGVPKSYLFQFHKGTIKPQYQKQLQQMQNDVSIP